MTKEGRTSESQRENGRKAAQRGAPKRGKRSREAAAFTRNILAISGKCDEYPLLSNPSSMHGHAAPCEARLCIREPIDALLVKQSPSQGSHPDHHTCTRWQRCKNTLCGTGWTGLQGTVSVVAIVAGIEHGSQRPMLISVSLRLLPTPSASALCLPC